MLERHKTLNLLKKRIRFFKEGYRQNVAIIGEKLIGKTELLKHFLNDFDDEHLSPVYVEIVPFELHLFVKRFFNSLLFHYIRKLQIISSREDLPLLIKMAKKHLPDTSAHIERTLQNLAKEKPEIIFKDLFSLIEIFQKESGKRSVIIFDEFTNLKTLGVKSICQELGKKIMFFKNTFFLFSSSCKTEAHQILSEDLSLLFGNFETIELFPLDSEASMEMIEKKFSPIGISEELKNFLVHFSGGYPFYLGLICEKTASHGTPSKTTIDRQALLDTLEGLLFDQWGILNLKFTAFLTSLTSGRNKNELLYILDAIASGKNRLKDLTLTLRRPKKELTLKINRLIEHEILSKNGSFFLIKDRLLGFWLKFVHAEKMKCLSTDLKEQAAYFRNRLSSEIDRFVSTSKKPVPQRVLELFNAFDGEAIQLGRKRFELCTFRDLKLIALDETDLKVGILGKTKDAFWITAIKEDGIVEHDILELLQLAKKYKHKVVNKIVIGLGETDHNARLLAKESSVHAWDIAALNNLFDLFGQPRIIKTR